MFKNLKHMKIFYRRFRVSILDQKHFKNMYMKETSTTFITALGYSLRSVLHLRPVFEGAGEPGIFSVPEPGAKLGIFVSPRAYMEETVRRVTSRQQAIFKGGGSLELFQVSRI